MINILLRVLGLLGKQLELSLASLITGTFQMLQGLLACIRRLAANDTTMLVVLEVLAGKTTGSMVSSAMHHFCATTDNFYLTSDHLHVMHNCIGSCIHVLTPAHFAGNFASFTTSFATGSTALTTLHHRRHFLEGSEIFTAALKDRELKLINRRAQPVLC